MPTRGGNGVGQLHAPHNPETNVKQGAQSLSGVSDGQRPANEKKGLGFVGLTTKATSTSQENHTYCPEEAASVSLEGLCSLWLEREGREEKGRGREGGKEPLRAASLQISLSIIVLRPWVPPNLTCTLESVFSTPAHSIYQESVTIEGRTCSSHYCPLLQEHTVASRQLPSQDRCVHLCHLCLPTL